MKSAIFKPQREMSLMSVETKETYVGTFLWLLERRTDVRVFDY